MLNNLRKQLENDFTTRKAETAFYIQHGYFKEWPAEYHKESDKGIEKYSTSTRWDQYNDGKITREKAVELATKRMEKDKEKYFSKRMETLETAKNAPDLKFCYITVEWKHNKTWGWNPTAEVRTNTGTYYGHASGCGYDKLTAAIGSALNQCPAVLKMLYTKKEKELTAGKTAGESETNRYLIHYGAGYGILPYFEGGVGIGSFYGVFKACGYRLRETACSKHFNAYSVERMED
jgi:hypothetical protein